MPPCVHDAAGLPLVEFSSVEDFLERDTLTAGLRSIALADGNHLDIAYSRELVPGDDHATPVFFNGALSDRTGTTPPYLSGLGIGERLDLPVVAIADPLFNVNDDLLLAWYAGVGSHGLQDDITRILRSLADRLGRLLMVGGSGGGFASLLQAERLGPRASAFVWNPQTDLLLYAPPTVRAYLASALDDDEWLDPSTYEDARAREALAAAGIQYRVESLAASASSLVVQNATDWHVDVHARPLAQRSELSTPFYGARTNASENQVMVLSSYGDGHAPAPSSAIELAVKRMATLASAREVYREMLFTGALPIEDFGTLPWGDQQPQPTAADGTATADYSFHGKDLRITGLEGDAIFEHVRTRKEPYERILLDELADLLRPEGLFLDVGANIGNHSIALAASKGIRVVAFEPLPQAADLLDTNIHDNGLNHLVLVDRRVVGRSAGHAAVGRVDPANIGATQFQVAESGTEMTCLDDLPLPRVQLIKVDAEGMDVEVLRGAAKLIDRDRPWIVCEASTLSELDALDEFAADSGYAYVGRFNATPTFLLMPARPGVESIRVNRRLVERLTATNLLARDLNWRVRSLSQSAASN